MTRFISKAACLCSTGAMTLASATGTSGAAGTSSRLASSQPSSTTITVVVSPSRLARTKAMTHFAQIVEALPGPNVTIVGTFEQIKADDGRPFDQAFLISRSPALPALPVAQPVGSPCTGTIYQRKSCERAEQGARSANAARSRQYQLNVSTAYTMWQRSVVAQLMRLSTSGPTEESPNGVWNLRGALTVVGQMLAILPPGPRCVVLLGGLAVRRPPAALPIDLLNEVDIVAAGWQGTQKQEETWRTALQPAGASITFLPNTITDLMLLGGSQRLP